MTVEPAHQQILAGAAATLSWQPTDSDGVAAAPDGAVTVGIVRADGTVLVAAGAATGGTGTAARTYALTGAQTASLDLLTATWTDSGGGAAVTTIAIVGGYYWSPSQARAVDESLADTSRYPDAALIRVRRQTEDEFETLCCVAFVPRYRWLWLNGTGRTDILLPVRRPRIIRSARIYSDATTYTAFTSTELAALQTALSGVVTRRDGQIWPAGTLNIAVGVEHGHDRPPEDVRVASIRRARQHLNTFRSSIPDGAERWTTPEGTIVCRVGDPDIDAVLARHDLTTPGVA